jgi:hypothetical protein
MTGKVTVGGRINVQGDIRADGKLRIRNPADNFHFTDNGATTEQTVAVTVPVGVTILSPRIQGAGGRSVDGASGGKGAGIQALLHVTPGDVVRVRIARRRAEKQRAMTGQGSGAERRGAVTLIRRSGRPTALLSDPAVSPTRGFPDPRTRGQGVLTRGFGGQLCLSPSCSA